MISIGETLRRERLRQGLDLQQVSASTKIGTRMLQAMEADQFEKLPGGVFTRSFVKQYAAVLGLDSAGIESEYQRAHGAADDPMQFDTRRAESTPSLAQVAVDSNSLFASVVWVLLAIIVCAGIYFIMNRVPSGPKVQVTSSEAPAKPSEKRPSEAKTTPQTPPPVTAAPAAGPVQVTITASEPSWISVSADGKNQFTGILQPNEKKEIAATDNVKVVAGNAGGLGISLNGKSIEAIGPKGQVRTVELTTGGAHVVSRTPKPAAPLL